MDLIEKARNGPSTLDLTALPEGPRALDKQIDDLSPKKTKIPTPLISIALPPLIPISTF
jgi:hypothetical protein